MMRLAYLLLVLLVVVTGCQKEGRSTSSLQQWMGAAEKIRVLSTTAMIDDIVGLIGGEKIVHIPLILGEIDPHSYELVKGDDEKLSLADVIFYNGLGLEHGASLRYQIEHHPHAIAVADAVKAAHPDQIIYVDREIDPHLWMDVSLWSEIVPVVVRALASLDPESSSYFADRGKRVQEQMMEMHVKIQEDLYRIPPEKRYLVTSHDAFNYFTRAYLATPDEQKEGTWWPRFEAPEGLAPDGQLGAYDIQQIVDHLALFDVHVIFPESNVSRDSLKKIIHACQQKGFQVSIAKEVLYGDAMGPQASDADTYLKMVRHDADALILAWRS